MDFELPEELREIQRVVRELAATGGQRYARERDASADLPWDAVRRLGPLGITAKPYAREAAMRATVEVIQIPGGHGYTEEFRVERYFRDARPCEIGEGTSEVQRIVISREILR